MNVIVRLEKLLAFGSCMCGHGESCSVCSSISPLNLLKDEIRKIIKELKEEARREYYGQKKES